MSILIDFYSIESIKKGIDEAIVRAQNRITVTNGLCCRYTLLCCRGCTSIFFVSGRINQIQRNQDRGVNSMKAYKVKRDNFSAAKPFAVIATFRSFNKVIARYSDASLANRRARDLNAKFLIQQGQQVIDDIVSGKY